jgi:ABC-2 type transport system permease protein
MKFWEIVRFEIAYQARRPWTWVYFVALVGITYQITTESYIGGARRSGFFFNAPFVIAAMTVMGSAFGLLVVASAAGDAGARDIQTRMHPLVYASPVRKGTYLRGRFLAAFCLSAVMLCAVPIALLICLVAPGVPRDLLGPFQLRTYLAAYVVFMLPTVFATTALLFAMATLSRRAITAYLGAVVLFFLTMFMWQFVAGTLGQWTLAKFLDPLGFTLISEISKTTTSADKNRISIALAGWVLVNRAVWVGVGLAALAFTHFRFRFAHPTMRSWRRERLDDQAAPAADRATPTTVPRARGAFGFAARAHQTRSIVVESFRSIALSWGGLVLIALSGILTIAGPQSLNHLGVPLLPTTGRMLDFVGNTGEVLWMIVPVLTVFYIGELVWREREAGLNEIADAAPVPEWVRLAGKFLGLSLIFVAYHAMIMLACMLIQVQLGYYDLEIGLYTRVLFGLQLVDHLLFALLAFAVHVVVNQKYIGHFVVILAYAMTAFAAAFGINHKLLTYGAAPSWQYSDMRGFGASVAPWMWFKLYWGAWALLLALATKLLWVRGREPGVMSRLELARRRMTRPSLSIAALAGMLVIALGGYNFYNTNVLNAYELPADGLRRRAEYERRYRRFDRAAQPSLTGTDLRVEIYPERREVEIRGTYRLVNLSGKPLDSIYFGPDVEVENGPARLDRPATLALDDKEVGFRIYALGKPLLPNDSLELAFSLRFKPTGFTNDGIDPSVTENGTFFEGNDWLPDIGYQSERELTAASDRRTYGLSPRPAVATLEDIAARNDRAGAERIAFEAVVGTADGQTAVAPGILRRIWTEKGRRYFHYVTDTPIRNDFSIFSARYAMRKARWRDVAIEVLHHPRHALNVGRMVSGVQASLEYFTKTFGPYPYRVIRLVEHPGDSPSLHASPINVSFQEGFSLMNPAADSRDIDFPFSVVSHEVAHTWWGNQLSPANVQGAPLLSESLAWYSSFCVVRETMGEDHLHRLLSMMREVYLTPQLRAAQPLLRSYDRLIGYRKGAFAMYALGEYVGTDRVHDALRTLLQTHAAGAPPFPTSLDLYRELRAVTPDSLQYLLVDLFEKNTFWDLSTKQAVVERSANGQFRVTLTVNARKVVVDTAGAETEVPMNDLVEVGAFVGTSAKSMGERVYLGLHRIRSGEQVITIMAPKQPTHAGLDPRVLLIDPKGGDNLKEVSTPP